LFALDGFETPSKPPEHATYSDRVDVSVYPVGVIGSNLSTGSDW